MSQGKVIGSKLRTRSGYALIWVLIMLVTLSLLGTTLLLVAMSETKHASRSYRKIQTNYIARSGVEAGYKRLLEIKDTTNISALIASANAKYQSDFPVNPPELGSCKYTISYAPDASGFYIIITSTATSLATPTIASTVSLYVASKIEGTSWVEPPKVWSRASNLWDGVDPTDGGDYNQSGNAIVLTGAPTKSPQNSVEPSEFKASALYFRGYNNEPISFLQQINTNDITLNSEVLIFDRGISLRDDAAFILKNDNPGDLANWSYGGETGFETFNVYENFVDGGSSGIQNLSPAEELQLQTEYEENYYPTSGSAKFKDGHYGLLRIGGPVKNSLGTSILSSSSYPAYFYYPSGVNLNSSTDIGGLIPLASNDKILTIFESHMGSPKVVASTNKEFYQDG